jgi:hypothetical protein
MRPSVALLEEREQRGQRHHVQALQGGAAQGGEQVTPTERAAVEAARDALRACSEPRCVLDGKPQLFETVSHENQRRAFSQAAAIDAILAAPEDTRLRDAADRVVCTAEPIMGAEGDDMVVTGYLHKTGAMHALIAVLREHGAAGPLRPGTPPAPCPGCAERDGRIAELDREASDAGWRASASNTRAEANVLRADAAEKALAEERERREKAEAKAEQYRRMLT